MQPYAEAAVKVYVTSMISPEITDRAVAKRVAASNVPDVALLALLELRNAPYIVLDALIVNVALLALLVTDWDDGADSTYVWRTVSEYAVLSVAAAGNAAIVSPATGV
jgi:hypothetical protein